MAIFKVYISGTEDQATDQYNIREQAGQSSTATLDVLADATHPVPQSHQRLEIKDLLDVPIYTGIIQAVDSPSYSSGEEVRRYRVTAKDLTVVFDNRIVNFSV